MYQVSKESIRSVKGPTCRDNPQDAGFSTANSVEYQFQLDCFSLLDPNKNIIRLL